MLLYSWGGSPHWWQKNDHKPAQKWLLTSFKTSSRGVHLLIILAAVLKLSLRHVPAVDMENSLKENRFCDQKQERLNWGCKETTKPLTCYTRWMLLLIIRRSKNSTEIAFILPFVHWLIIHVFSSGKCQRHYDILGYLSAVPFWSLDRTLAELTSCSCEFADIGYFNTHAKSSCRLP